MSKNFVSYQDANALMTAIGNKFKTAVATAENVSYDNTNSGLEATNVQDAIDEICNNPPGPDVPDGKTVTPINDVVIWQQCAGITNPYTTLGEVLADTGVLSALIASENAVDYLVRSTTWAVAQALVPTMTSYTTPSGTASASSEWSNDKAWKAFDGVNSGDSRWSCSGSGSQYLQYVFDSPIVVDYIEYSIDSHSAYSTNITFSGDESTLATIAKPTSSGTLIKQKLSVVEAHTTFRWAYTSTGICGVRELQFYSPSITDNSTAMSYIGLNNYCANTLLADSTWCEAICNSEYFESVLNVKVPTMTSNTTPSGECSASSVNNSQAYNAYDNVLSAPWASSGRTDAWSQYKFSSAVNIICFGISPGYGASGNIQCPKSALIKYSDNGTNFTDIETYSISLPSSDSDKTWQRFALPYSNISHQYWRAFFEEAYGSTASAIKVFEIQFYGREDV